MADLAWFVSVTDTRDRKSIVAKIRTMKEQDANGNRDLSYGRSVSISDCPYAEVSVTCNTYDSWLADDMGNDWVYGSELLWDEAFNLANAEVGIKALRKIHKYLTDAHEIAGPPSGFAQWFLRIMKATKVNRVIMEFEGEKRNVNSEYACQLLDLRWKEWRNAARGIMSKAS